MKLIYIANIRLPTERAHGIQIMKMCEAFAGNGNDVTLVIPRRSNRIKGDIFAYYGINSNFNIKRLPTLDLVFLGKIGFLIQSISFAKFAALYALFVSSDIVYSRDEWPLFFISFFKNNLVFEGHTNRYNFVIKRVLKKSKKIITITQGLKDFYIANGIDGKKIFVSPDGVDLEQFSISASKEECRKKLQLPQDRKIIMYTGHLYEWKGVYTLADTASLFVDNELVVFVGGTEKDIENFKERYSGQQNILIIGKRPHKEIPLWLKSADVLVLPNTAKDDISRLYTSPMKLFEYMASGVPIVASDLPSIREILNKNNSFLINPDELDALAEGIKVSLKSDEVSKQAIIDIVLYTWKKRVLNIIECLKKLPEKK